MQCPGLIGCAEAIAAEIPAHEAAIEKDFTSEWRSAVSAFSAVLSKRCAIEAVLGRRLPLPEAKADPERIRQDADVSRPKEILESIRTSLGKLVARAPDVYLGPMSVPFDPGKIYILRVAAQDANGPLLEPGAPLIERSMDPGWVAFYVSLGNAAPYDDPDCTGVASGVRSVIARLYNPMSPGSPAVIAGGPGTAVQIASSRYEESPSSPVVWQG